MAFLTFSDTCSEQNKNIMNNTLYEVNTYKTIIITGLKFLE